MEFLLGLLKNIPWKKLTPLATVLIIVNILVFWIYGTEPGKVPVSLLYISVISSFVIITISAILSSLSKMKKIDLEKKPSTEQTFKDDIAAENSEFGVIKGNPTTNSQTKLTFEGKVNAPGSKFGNIEK